MTSKETPSADPAKEQSSPCMAPPASANPAESQSMATRRDVLKAGGMLGLSSLMGTAALMVPATAWNAGWRARTTAEDEAAA